MEQGHDIVNSCWGPLYVVGPVSSCPVQMIYRWHPFLFGSCGLFAVPDALDRAPALGATKAPAYFYRKPFAGTYYPRAKALPVNRRQMLGSEMCSWGLDDGDEIPMLRRRLAAMSERIWNPEGSGTYESFRDRLDVQDDRLEALLADVRRASESAAAGMTPFVNVLRVSDVLPGIDLRGMKAPRGPRLRSRTFPRTFCDMHGEIAAAGAGIVVFACRVRCESTMRLAVCLGYDGPAKAWWDAEEVLLDPRGACPARPDKAVIPMTVAEGEHELHVALDADGGNAWGIFLRFQRLDRPDLLPKVLG